MAKLAVTLTAAALLFGSAIWSVQAQTQGAGTINTQAQNATIVHKAACFGFGRWCPPGRHRVCARYRCWCAPC